jgi:DNA-binding response OmpR family regulator
MNFCYLDDNKEVSRLPRILLIEDQKDAQRIVRAVFGGDIELICAENLGEGTRQLKERSFDLLLLDGNLPDGDGFEFFATLRREPAFAKLPVIFLTSRGEINDRVAAFAMGADDYVVKPLEPREFRARVDAKLKKIASKDGEGLLHVGNLRIDRHRLRTFRIAPSGEATEFFLTPYEFKLLSAFVENEDSVLTRDQLINAAWGESVHVLERTVDRHVSSLRKKLGDGAGRILPVHGIGYRFNTTAKAGKAKIA